MKKWICLSLVLITLLLFTACGASDADSSEPAPQLHTVAPQADLPEPEWAHIDATMALTDGTSTYAQGSDFLCFALISDGNTFEIRFKLDDKTADMLRAQPAGQEYSITLNGEKIGGAALNDACDEVTLTGSFTYSELCTIADRIRGFE